jgi:hypothetical protein
MAKNKQPNGQKFGPKMAKALLARCNELEDAVLSQAKIISDLRSEIANNNLGHKLMADRYEEMKRFVELKRPDVERLINVMTKRKALEQIQLTGALPQINLTVVKRKRKPKVPPLEPVLKPQDAATLMAEAFDEVRAEYKEGYTRKEDLEHGT